jgi:hypothetical protein
MSGAAAVLFWVLSLPYRVLLLAREAWQKVRGKSGTEDKDGPGAS